MIRTAAFITASISVLVMAGWATAQNEASNTTPSAANTTGSAPRQVQDSAGASSAGTPTADGPTILERACTVCHSVDTVLAERKIAAGWRDSIESMAGRGADLTEGEIKT